MIQIWNDFRLGLRPFLRNEWFSALLLIASFVPLTALVCMAFGVFFIPPLTPFSSLWWDDILCLLLCLILVVFLCVAVAKRVVVNGREAANWQVA